jgi:Outer membrane protein Omp28
MKKITLLMAGIVMVMASCQKDESISQGPISDSSVQGKSTANTIKSSLPASFTRKVLAEEYSGKTYGNVPMSNATLASLSSTYNGYVYVASFHDNDMLETTEADLIRTALPGGSTTTFPSASINRTDVSGSRFVSYGDYTNMVNQAIQGTTDCGLAITSKISGTAANIKVFCGFNNTMLGNYNLNVYLIEDNVKDKDGSLAQSNNFNNDHQTSFYQLGNPILGYTHNNVVRKVLTSYAGHPIDSKVLVPGGISTSTFNIDIPTNIDPANCHIIAFITMQNSNGMGDNICNVQKAKLGATQNWN